MTQWSYHTLAFFTAHLIAMSSTVYNPFVYAWYNDTFRRQFQTIAPCCRSGRYLPRNDGASRRRIETDLSLSRFATAGLASSDADTNHALSLSVDGQATAAVTAPTMELSEITSSPHAEKRQT